MNELQTYNKNEETAPIFEKLHLWDLIVLNAEALANVPEYFGANGLIRSRNPNAVVVAYFSAADVKSRNSQSIAERFMEGLEPNWYLRDSKGHQIRLFHLASGEWTLALNMNTPLNVYMPQYLSQNLFGDGAIDGVYFDWVTPSISWLNHVKPARGPIDIDNDGHSDSDRNTDRKWAEGFLEMLRNSRRRFPEGTLIIGNGGWNTTDNFLQQLNGIVLEDFMVGAQRNPKRFGWGALMRTYASFQRASVRPRMSIIVAKDNLHEFAKMRFALASTLMFDGYFCFTSKFPSYRTSWWYDEYSVDLHSGKALQTLEAKGYLGKPTGVAFDVDKPIDQLGRILLSNASKAEKRVWRRDFENGIALVNPTTKLQTIKFTEKFRKIAGTHDPQFNDGSTVSEISLPPNSGAILLRAASEIKPPAE